MSQAVCSVFYPMLSENIKIKKASLPLTFRLGLYMTKERFMYCVPVNVTITELMAKLRGNLFQLLIDRVWLLLVQWPHLAFSHKCFQQTFGVLESLMINLVGLQRKVRTIYQHNMVPESADQHAGFQLSKLQSLRGTQW